MGNLAVFYPEGHESHFERGHPERPERVEAIRQSLQSLGWWSTFEQLSPVELSDDLLSSIHDPAYLKLLMQSSLAGRHLDMDTYTTPASWQLALNAAGGAVAIASAVWQGKYNHGLALTRPPGHHATVNRGMGFCLLNNIAIAAQYLLKQPGPGIPKADRLVIVDLDLHHGNGTQDIFWSRNDVFFISTHQSPLYPGTGHLEDIGVGEGRGYTANFSLPPGTGDRGFSTVMSELILPLIEKYSPSMLLVSVGFDAHWSDPLGHLQLSALGYGNLISQLKGWAEKNCDGRIALFLEGGYNLDAGAACIQSAVAALLGYDWVDPLGPSPRSELNSWSAVVEKAKKIWNL